MRDRPKLRAFELATTVVMDIYRVTRCFPKDELFGLTSQLRRAALGIASNIVEGCARANEADYLRFLDFPDATSRRVSSIEHRRRLRSTHGSGVSSFLGCCIRCA